MVLLKNSHILIKQNSYPVSPPSANAYVSERWINSWKLDDLKQVEGSILEENMIVYHDIFSWSTVITEEIMINMILFFIHKS